MATQKVITVPNEPAWQPPDGAMSLTRNGWEYDAQPERIDIVSEGMNLQEAMMALVQQQGGLLGEGEIVFACVDLKGTIKHGMLVWGGWIAFVPS